MARKDREDELKPSKEQELTKAKPKSDAKESSFSVEKKIEQIMASNLPQAEKDAYIRRLTGDVSKNDSDRVPFIVYANIKKIKQEMRGGMLKHRSAASVAVATIAEWDEIFKDF